MIHRLLRQRWAFGLTAFFLWPGLGRAATPPDEPV